jgi:hypothetical protein
MKENNIHALYCGFKTSKGGIILKWNQYLKEIALKMRNGFKEC